MASKKGRKNPLNLKRDLRDFGQMQCVILWILIQTNQLHMRYLGIIREI